MRQLNELTPTQKMKSPFVAKVQFWNKSRYQGKFLEWNFRSDMLPTINKNSTIKDHLEHLIEYVKQNILSQYGFELCTIFENMNILSNYETARKNVVLQCSENALYYDNRKMFNFDEIIKNNEFYIAESWNDEVMMFTLNRAFIERMKSSFREQTSLMLTSYKNTRNVYKTYRETWGIDNKSDMNYIS